MGDKAAYLTDTSTALVEALRRLGDEYGPMGVALTAVALTDQQAVMARLAAVRERAMAHDHAMREHDGYVLTWCPACAPMREPHPAESAPSTEVQ